MTTPDDHVLDAARPKTEWNETHDDKAVLTPAQERALQTADVTDLSDDDLVALVDAAARSADETGWTGREVKALEELRRRNPPVEIDPDSIQQGGFPLW